MNLRDLLRPILGPPFTWAMSSRELTRTLREADPTQQQSIALARSAPLDLPSYAVSNAHSDNEYYWRGDPARSLTAVDLLVLRATAGEWDWASIGTALTDERMPTWFATHGEGLLTGALLACMIEPTAENFHSAHQVITLFLQHSSNKQCLYRERLLTMAVQVGLIIEDDELLSALDEYASDYPFASMMAAADRKLPFNILPEAREGDSFSSEGEIREWAEAFNAPFVREGVEAWVIDPSEPRAEVSVFDRIEAPIVAAESRANHEGASPLATRDPLVSIIVPVFNPGPTFAGTIDSLLRQSWRHLEIIIVDDASTKRATEIRAAADRDHRIRVIRMNQNGGAYAARNRGFQAATGTYVTVQDADDLAHPRRIEYQVRLLEEDGGMIGNTIRSLRLSSSGQLTLYGVLPERENVSSFMFRRQEVLHRVGFNLETRKGGDSEFHARVAAAFPERHVYASPRLLSLVQLTPNSVSRSDYGLGTWRTGDRLAFLRQYESWHRRTIAKQGVGGVHYEPSDELPFAVPASLQGAKFRKHVDLAVVGSWQQFLEEQADLSGLVRELAGVVQKPIGLLNGFHPRREASPMFTVNDATAELVDGGAAEWISWNQAATIDTLIIAEPELALLLPIAGEVNVKPKRLVVIVEDVVQLPGHRNSLIDLGVIEQLCVDSLGIAPEWVAASDALSERLRAAAKRGEAPIVTRAVIRREGNMSKPRPWPASRPVTVGIADIWARRPVAFEGWLRRALAPLKVELRFLGDEQMRTAELDDIDVLVLDPFGQAPQIRHGAIWRAMHQGMPVIGSPIIREVYSEAVAISKPRELALTMRLLMSSAELRDRQRDAQRVLLESRSLADVIRGSRI